MTGKVMVEAFRGDASFVMPEIFYQASKGLKTMDPGLKIAGVTRGWESIVFALKQFRFLIEPLRNDE